VKVYVAGSSKEMERAERVMNALRAAGHEITADWVAKIREVGVANPADFTVRLAAAQADLDGVNNADAFVFLHPAPGVQTTGAWVELGYRLAHCDSYAKIQRFTWISYERVDALSYPCIFDALVTTPRLIDEDIPNAIDQACLP